MKIDLYQVADIAERGGEFVKYAIYVDKWPEIVISNTSVSWEVLASSSVAILAILYSNWNVNKTIRSQEYITERTLNAEIRLKQSQSRLNDIDKAFIEFLCLLDNFPAVCYDKDRFYNDMVLDRLNNKAMDGFLERYNTYESIFEEHKSMLNKLKYKLEFEFRRDNAEVTDKIIASIDDLFVCIFSYICIKPEIISTVSYEKGILVLDDGTICNINEYTNILQDRISKNSQQYESNCLKMLDKKDILIQLVNEYFIQKRDELKISI